MIPFAAGVDVGLLKSALRFMLKPQIQGTPAAQQRNEVMFCIMQHY